MYEKLIACTLILYQYPLVTSKLRLTIGRQSKKKKTSLEERQFNVAKSLLYVAKIHF